MIYLNPEVKTSENEDTFWDWAERVFPKSSFNIPTELNDNDIVLRYSTLGFLPVAGKSIALCWEMYPQMQRLYFNNQYAIDKLNKINEAARYCTYRSVATEQNAQYYRRFGSVEVIPIGVDTDFWKPINNKELLRDKHGIPLTKKVGIWVGSLHHMKGFANVLQYASNNPDIFWIIVIGRNNKSLTRFPNSKIYMDIPQKKLVELMQLSDFYLCTNRLSSYYMADWEAMACNLSFEYQTEVKPEFIVGTNSRDSVFEHKWSRELVQKQWEDFFDKHGVEYK